MRIFLFTCCFKFLIPTVFFKQLSPLLWDPVMNYILHSLCILFSLTYLPLSVVLTGLCPLAFMTHCRVFFPFFFIFEYPSFYEDDSTFTVTMLSLYLPSALSVCASYSGFRKPCPSHFFCFFPYDQSTYKQKASTWISRCHGVDGSSSSSLPTLVTYTRPTHSLHLLYLPVP